MVSTFSTSSTDKTTGSSAGASPKFSTKHWSQKLFSEGTIGSIENILVSSTTDSDLIIRLSGSDQISSPHDTQSGIKLTISKAGQITLEQIEEEHKRRLESGAFEKAESLANRWHKPDIDFDEDELLIDEPIPDIPKRVFQVKAKITSVDFIKISRPIGDEPENDLIDDWIVDE